MSWVKLDDRFTDNPKVAELSDKAFRAHVEALCYVAGALTDGRISAQIARRWGVKVRSELIQSGLWDATRIGGGYQIHDYLDYNPARTDVVANREAKSKAGAMGAAKRWAKPSANADFMPPSPTPTPTPKPGPTDRNPNQPTEDQLYLAEKLGDLTPAAIVKLNQKHGRVKVEDAMRLMRGFPPEEKIRSSYAYLDSMAGGFDD